MTHLGLTLDAVHAPTLAVFWQEALGYEVEPPPEPFATREEWLASHDVPEEEWTGAAYLRDPAGVGPRLSILEVPEPKTAKNRLHLDLYVSREVGEDERWSHVLARVEAFVALGGAVVAVVEDHHVVMADPEGNEFCVA